MFIRMCTQYSILNEYIFIAFSQPRAILTNYDDFFDIIATLY